MSIFGTSYRRLGYLAVLLILTFFFSTTLGAAAVSVADVCQVIAYKIQLSANPPTQIHEAIIWDTRLPRVISGVGVGAILGVSGVALQTIVRNDLAEPYVLGVSAGASAGAAFAMIFLSITTTLAVTGFAFIGAAISILIVVAVGTKRSSSSLTLILTGLGVGFAFQAITNLIIFAAKTPEASRAVLFWTLGSLTRATWENSWASVILGIVITLFLVYTSPLLDALSSGDRTTLTIGINPNTARIILLIPVSLAVAGAVSTAGGIGFVGLIIPHLIRNYIGYHHRSLVIGSALGGSIFLTLTDALSRIIFTPSEVPLGVITGLIGAPFLLFIVISKTTKLGGIK